MLDTPVGELSYAVDDIGVCKVHFGATEGARSAQDETGEQLRAYFAGELTEFTVPVHVKRGNEFERSVWEQMKLIPFGETRSYGAVATAVGEQKYLRALKQRAAGSPEMPRLPSGPDAAAIPPAAQAVGVACNRNPLPIIVPCHRIIGSDGKLVGFGGGLERKRILLELEAKVKMELDWR